MRPAVSASEILRATIEAGKFQGVMAPTTPIISSHVKTAGADILTETIRYGNASSTMLVSRTMSRQRSLFAKVHRTATSCRSKNSQSRGSMTHLAFRYGPSVVHHGLHKSSCAYRLQ